MLNQTLNAPTYERLWLLPAYSWNLQIRLYITRFGAEVLPPHPHDEAEDSRTSVSLSEIHQGASQMERQGALLNLMSQV